MIVQSSCHRKAEIPSKLDIDLKKWSYSKPMAESQSLVPVAAIVDLILGFVTIALVRRSEKNGWRSLQV